jgi:hypothetical protein
MGDLKDALRNLDLERARRTWEGDWRARIRERVRNIGFGSVSQFLAAFPTQYYTDVADRLGEVAAIQLEVVQFDEAESPTSFREACKDSLVRDLNHYLTSGWEGGTKGNFPSASACATWKGRVGGTSRNVGADPGRERLAKAVWDCLEQLKPPLGWLPKTADDPLIAAALEKGWPKT